MSNDILFIEKQKFNQWWLWLIILGTNALFLYGIYKQIIGKQQFGNNPMSDTGLLISALAVGLLTVLFIFFRLETIVKNDGVYVRFFPFQLKFKRYSWDTVSVSYIRKYSPIAEYGGWGLRVGLFGKGMAFNVSGNMGLQLEFHSKKKLLIGTNKPEELTDTLRSIGQIKH